MRLRKKVLIAVVSCLLCIALTVSVLAVSGVGSSFDESHSADSCCSPDGGEPHYNMGYWDGVADANGLVESMRQTIDSLQKELDGMDSSPDDSTESSETDSSESTDNSNADNSGSNDSSNTDNSGTDNPGSNDSSNTDNSGTNNSGSDDSDNTDNSGNDSSSDDSSSDEPNNDDYWKRKYLNAQSMLDEATWLLAEFHICLSEANTRLEILGGEPVMNPTEGAIEDIKFTTIADAEKAIVIAQYLASEEYVTQQVLREEIVVSEYKGSEEFKEALKEQYELGTQVTTEQIYNSAYAEAYDIVYSLGVSDGYANYTGTEQYANTLNKAQQSAYEQGYNDGYDSSNTTTSTKSEEIDMTSIIAMIVGVIGLLIVFVIVINITKKKRRKK